jgi:hypothetical protein
LGRNRRIIPSILPNKTKFFFPPTKSEKVKG